MPIEQKNRYIEVMEAFVASHSCDWALKARNFIETLKKRIVSMSAEAFKSALHQWDEIVNKAPREVWVSYAYSR